jgi:hypothetical protein
MRVPKSIPPSGRWGGDWAGQEGEASSVLSVHNLQQHSAAFTHLLLHRGLGEVLGQLVPGSVVLHHTKVPPE